MRFSEQWLREWVNPPVDTEQLAFQLTMSGLEVAAVESIVGNFSNVVVGFVQSIRQHPNADKLRLCTVNVGGDEELQIVCGAKNVAEKMKVPVALLGAVLPNGFKIKLVKLRGIESCGMICSTTELGLTESSDGIMQLAADAPIGRDIRKYLQLDDKVIEIELTPNRGDCLSIAGIAREVATIYRCQHKIIEIQDVTEKSKEVFQVKLSAADKCPHYVGRVIKDINPAAQTPLWMQERIRRSGLNVISPVVDVTNYVLLELGQPMHAFDLAKLQKKIIVRDAQENEELTLLDGQTLKLTADDLVIADKSQPVALAGIMGGAATSVTKETRDIFLESAYFNPIQISKTAKFHGLNTDSSHRFERGVDPNLQVNAIKRATELLVRIVGGYPGPIIETKDSKYLPQAVTISLRTSQIKRILGIEITDNDIADILTRLGCNVFKIKGFYEIKPPTYRFDLTTEIDLIEELARIYGYNLIPEKNIVSELSIHAKPEAMLDMTSIRNLLVDKGYNEIITYSFVDPKLQELLDQGNTSIRIKNPISADMAVMRTNLLTGLIRTVRYNLHRQHSRIRIFESGMCFTKRGNELFQDNKLAGAIAGNIVPEQWGASPRTADFYDLKNDIYGLFDLINISKEISFAKGAVDVLHPGKSAIIYRQNKSIGYCGALHPKIKNSLRLHDDVYLFELDLSSIYNGLVSKLGVISKFPLVRRDLALLVDRQLPVDSLIQAISANAKDVLKNMFIFDVYQGDGIPDNKKSVAVGLLMQHNAHTLTDKEVEEFIFQLTNKLHAEFDISLRS